MSEEEIEKFREEKAIEIFRDKLEQEKKEIGRNSIYTIEYQIILDLIDKLQKENNNLNKKNKRYEKYLKNKDKEHEKVLEYIETEKERDYISKDKIRDKIEELKDLCLICQFRESFCKDLKERRQCVTNAIITVLENLLKE